MHGTTNRDIYILSILFFTRSFGWGKDGCKGAST